MISPCTFLDMECIVYRDLDYVYSLDLYGIYSSKASFNYRFPLVQSIAMNKTWNQELRIFQRKQI